MTEPKPPENVRLVLDDDTEVPVDCLFEGMRDDEARWVVLVPDFCQGRIESLKIDVFPAKTGIRLAMRQREA